MNRPCATKHFVRRFKQRLANTDKNRIQEYVENAYNLGVGVDAIRLKEFANLIRQRGYRHGTTAKIYKNYVYMFSGMTAITLYPIPQRLDGKLLG